MSTDVSSKRASVVRTSSPALFPRQPLWLFGSLLMLSLVCASPSLARSPSAKLVDPSQGRFWLGGYLSFLKDPSGQMTLEEVQLAHAGGAFEPVKDLAVTTGYRADKPLWIHFSTDYPVGDASIWWLLMAPELLESITVYAEQPDGHFDVHHGGKALPFMQREMEGIGHAFRLGQDPGGLRHYFIRMTTAVAIKVEPSLWKERVLSHYLYGVNATMGVYFGIVALLIVAALVRAVRFRHAWDIAYLIYIVGFELFNLTNAGLIQAWGLTDNMAIRQGLLQTGILITGLSFAALTRSLIVWPDRGTRWLRHWPLGGVLMLLSVLALTAALNPTLFLEVNFNSAVSLLGLSTLAGLWASWKNYANARLMTLCFLPFVLWAVYVTIARWLEAPIPDAWNRSRILMGTSLLHLFFLWFLILSQDARLERAKRQLESKLEILQSEMSNMSLFFGMLTHELNHPLQSLIGLAKSECGNHHSFDAGDLRPRMRQIGREFADILETCTQRIQQAASSTLMPEAVNLPALLKGIANHFQQKTVEHLVLCDLQALPPQFVCDPKLVGILLSNLLENAIRYSSPDSVIWVRGKAIDVDTVEITVEDEGAGIPKAMQREIFDRYVQLGNSSGAQRGIGMGLFIVKRIAEMHGGSATCESATDQGSTFRVILRRCNPISLPA